MKEQKIQRPPLMLFVFLSWFYTGTSPKAPGTIGSLGALPLIYLLDYLDVSRPILVTVIFILFLLAVITAEYVQKKLNLHDPSWIVVDEVIGMLVTWSFVPNVDWKNILLIFVSFRFFDIIKFWPASYFDRLHHGVGTIADDIISGLYAGIFCFLVGNYFNA